MKEIWRDIAGYEGLYQVSNYGRIKSLERLEKTVGAVRQRRRRERILKETNIYGYRNVCLANNGYKRTVRVHRIVAKTFIPNPDGKLEVNHIDGNKANNRVDNLEWCTRKENSLHSVKVLGNKSKIEQLKPFQFKRGYECWNKIPVKCVETGEIFDSIVAATKAKNISRGAADRISHCCSGKRCNGKNIRTVGGYHWEYA